MFDSNDLNPLGLYLVDDPVWTLEHFAQLRVRVLWQASPEIGGTPRRRDRCSSLAATERAALGEYCAM